MGGGGCQAGCKRRIEVFVKILKKNKFCGGCRGGDGRGRVGGGQGGCERRIEVFVKIQKKKIGGGGVWGLGWGGYRVDVNEELKFLGKLKKKWGGGGGGPGGRVGGSG